MARTVAKLSVYKGRYQRVLGQAVNSQGKLAPKKFLLGTDPRKAKLANARLEQFWDEVVAEHDHTLGFVRGADISVDDTNMITGEPAIRGDVQARRDFEGGPRWRGESLLLAEATRKHERSVNVPAWPPDRAGKGALAAGCWLRDAFTGQHTAAAARSTGDGEMAGAGQASNAGDTPAADHKDS